ncbi:hypothetical protein ACJJIQ_09190 [Microbulbifer sp. ANSA003]|uniref:Uncharacterized protein n=1 Tax=Microbulbifer okhotskensis TaxID=2926617 RepID=A0A9X2ETN1_9GAMM|nr:hypothetical protein [Microbulbifer okhotskensis]MCO1335343.1 hypothetical protein [Microbulbifer okhotskensis]
MAASVEMQGGLDPEAFARDLGNTRWPGEAIEPEARRTIDGLLGQLAEARVARQAQAQPN